VRVAIADDSVLLREGIASLLATNGFDVVAQVGTADELLDAVAVAQPEVVVIDVRMPPTNTDEGIQAAAVLGDRHPAVGALVLSQYVEAAYVMRLLEQRSAGRGYLLKDHVADVETFLDAIRTVARGGSFVDPDLVEQLLSGQRAEGPLARLSAREREVLSLMAEGRSNRAMSELLYVSPKTLETHIRNVFTKLDLEVNMGDDRRVMAVLRYLRSS
jgi:DNA-binding NarL/FixJ family response regulator